MSPVSREVDSSAVQCTVWVTIGQWIKDRKVNTSIAPVCLCRVEDVPAVSRGVTVNLTSGYICSGKPSTWYQKRVESSWVKLIPNAVEKRQYLNLRLLRTAGSEITLHPTLNWSDELCHCFLRAWFWTKMSTSLYLATRFKALERDIIPLKPKSTIKMSADLSRSLSLSLSLEQHKIMI